MLVFIYVCKILYMKGIKMRRNQFLSFSWLVFMMFAFTTGSVFAAAARITDSEKFVVISGNTSRLSALLRENSDLATATDSHGNTLLHFASMIADEKAARLLLDNGADTMRQNEHGDTPLDLARKSDIVRSEQARKAFVTLLENATSSQASNKNKIQSEVKCRNCGKYNRSGAKFCSYCGQKLVNKLSKQGHKWERAFSLRGHGASVEDVVFSPDGKLIATASIDHTVRVWDGVNGKLLKIFKGHASSVWSVVFSPDGKTIATASKDTTVGVWDVRSGRRLKELAARNFLGMYVGASLTGIAFNSQGNKIVTSGDRGQAEIWDVNRDKVILEMPDDQNGRYLWLAVDWQNNGNRIAIGSMDHKVRIFDSRSGKRLKTIDAHRGRVNDVCFSPDGKTLLTASADRTAKLWDMDSGELLRALSMQGFVWKGCFSSDGHYIVTASEDNAARIWNAESGELIQTLGHENAVRSVGISPDGKSIVTGDRSGVCTVWR